MGCFNSYGYMSNLPIRVGDDVFALICLAQKSNSPYISVDDYIQCPYLTPVCFPIFGKYDDYGSVTDIVEDEMVKYLQENTGLHIDRIVEVLTDCYRRVPDDDLKNDYKKIENSLLGDMFSNVYYQLCLTIEHKDVYQTISDLTIDDITKSYNICIENEHLLDEFYRPDFDNLNEQYTGKKNYINAVYNRYDETMNINPAIDSGYWGRWSDAFSGYMLLDIFRDYSKIEQIYWKDPRWKESYIRFMAFYYACAKMNWTVTLFRWGGRDEQYNWFNKIYKSFGNILEKYADRYNRYINEEEYE